MSSMTMVMGNDYYISHNIQDYLVWNTFNKNSEKRRGADKNLTLISKFFEV